MATAEAAARFGVPLTLPGFDTVQTLRPIEKDVSPPNTYSGNYGTDEFPLHTDMAHWAVPPRYLLLRCVIGAASVATRLLDGRQLVATIGDDSPSTNRFTVSPWLNRNRPITRPPDEYPLIDLAQLHHLEPAHQAQFRQVEQRPVPDR